MTNIKHIISSGCLLGVLLAGSGISAFAQDAAKVTAPTPIPFKPDPPPAIDGDLGEWQNSAPTFVLDRADQSVAGEKGWKSKDDLSARVWLAWRQEDLYIAADVRDDVLKQSQRGSNLWKGDHLELYLDTTPDTDVARTIFGTGQFQLGLSPGNFQKTGDAMFDTKPEAYFYLPAGTSAADVTVAARQTANGYTIEATIPWKSLGIESTPTAGLALPIVVGVSDTDGNEAAQEKMLAVTALPGSKWARNRAMLVPANLATADGTIPETAKAQELFDSVEVPARQSKEIRFDAPAVPAGRDAILVLNARLQTPKVGGYTPALRLKLNGQIIDGKRVINKEANETLVTGKTKPVAAGETFFTYYAPDYDSPDKSTSYAPVNGNATRLELRVTDLLQEGENVLTIENNVKSPIEYPLFAGNGGLQFRAPIVKKIPLPPPTGEIPTFVPDASHKVGYELSEGQAGVLQLKLDGVEMQIASQFSTPAGKWETGDNTFFKLQRTIEKKDGAIVVRETFTNLTGENLPLMQRREITTPGGFKKFWLVGLSPSSDGGLSSDASNPTTFGITDKVGVGLMPLDGVGIIHASNYANDGKIGLADNNLALAPNATHVSEWAIIPTEKPDYFAFINAARRLRDVNFQIDGPAAFLRINPGLTGKWSDEQIVNFVRNKSLEIIMTGISWPKYKGVVAHGTAFQTLDFAEWKKETARRRKLLPDVKQVVYFHSFINAHEDAPEKYKESRVTLSDGTPTDYGEAHYPIFLPTDTNAFGRDVRKNVDIILDELKFDGVYWDELERSRYMYTYGQKWDGVSADIDPRTMKITGLKSAVPLLSEKWRLDLAKYILSRGLLIGNGAPYTPAMMNLHFPRFVETGSISNCRLAQLYTPIALGDHLTERSEEDAYKVMLAALDYGCVYYWYNDMTVIPTHETLTKYMFPITPIELREGALIGKERIVTNRSGWYGWGDNAKHEIHVFDDKGREVKNIQAPTVARTISKDGKTLTELRLGEGWSAAIVRG
jgi:hypothetical protein